VASKGFYALTLPETHPVWTSQEAVPAFEQTDVILPLASIGLLIQRTAADGMVRVDNHGSDHLKPHEADAGGPDPLYARFSYLTRTGPTELHNPPDNWIQVEFENTWSVRRRIHRGASGDNWVSSWHAPRFPTNAPYDASPYSDAGPVLPSVRIESVTATSGALEVHLHRLVNVPPGSPLRLTSWSIAAESPAEISSEARALQVSVGQVPWCGVTPVVPCGG